MTAADVIIIAVCVVVSLAFALCMFGGSSVGEIERKAKR